MKYNFAKEIFSQDFFEKARKNIYFLFFEPENFFFSN